MHIYIYRERERERYSFHCIRSSCHVKYEMVLGPTASCERLGLGVPLPLGVEAFGKVVNAMMSGRQVAIVNSNHTIVLCYNTIYPMILHYNVTCYHILSSTIS